MTDELQKYVELYRQAGELDTEVLWQKVNTIRQAITAGADRDTLLSECGKESGDSRKQMAKFYAVARVFPEHMIAHDFDYWAHEAVALADGVDPENPATYGIAHTWLNTAIKGQTFTRKNKSGIVTTYTRKHTARTIKRAIRAASGDGKPKAEVVLNKVMCRVAMVDSYMTDPYTKLLLLTTEEIDTIQVDDMVQVTVTITRQPKPETEQTEVAT